MIETLTNGNASSTITKMHGNRNNFAKVRELLVPEAGTLGRVTSSISRWSTWYNEQQWSSRDFPLLKNAELVNAKFQRNIQYIRVKS